VLPGDDAAPEAIGATMDALRAKLMSTILRAPLDTSERGIYAIKVITERATRAGRRVRLPARAEAQARRRQGQAQVRRWQEWYATIDKVGWGAVASLRYFAMG